MLTLEDLVQTQPAVSHAAAWVRSKPKGPIAFLLEGPRGTGKTATAIALADRLGCHDEWSGFWTIPCTELTIDAARELFGRTLRLRFGSSSGYTVLLMEELEWLSPQCQRYLKTALDPLGSMPMNLCVIATSNNSSELDSALLDRFRLLSYSNGPTFRKSCQDVLVRMWSERTESPLPFGWEFWGANGNACSMRAAIRSMNEALEALLQGATP